MGCDTEVSQVLPPSSPTDPTLEAQPPSHAAGKVVNVPFSWLPSLTTSGIFMEIQRTLREDKVTWAGMKVGRGEASPTGKPKVARQRSAFPPFRPVRLRARDRNQTRCVCLNVSIFELATVFTVPFLGNSQHSDVQL